MNIASTQYTLKNKAFEIYISGCSAGPKCKGCHNYELWDFSIGEEYNKKYFEKLLKKITKFSVLVNKIMIMGGEPLDQNYSKFSKMICDLSNLNKELWLFTRYDLKDVPEAIKNKLDYIKCGRYIQELHTLNNIQYGINIATSNQKIYKKGMDY